MFELDIPPLEQQRRNREFELLVQTSIMNTIRDNLPVEQLLRQYIDETQEVDVHKVETIIENKPIFVESENNIENNIENELPKGIDEKKNTIRFNPDVNTIDLNDLNDMNDMNDTSELKIGDEVNIDLNVQNLECDMIDLDIEEIL